MKGLNLFLCKKSKKKKIDIKFKIGLEEIKKCKKRRKKYKFVYIIEVVL